jgi:hypothetical protein
MFLRLSVSMLAAVNTMDSLASRAVFLPEMVFPDIALVALLNDLFSNSSDVGTVFIFSKIMFLPVALQNHFKV